MIVSAIGVESRVFNGPLQPQLALKPATPARDGSSSVADRHGLTQLDYEPLRPALHAIAARAGHRLAGRRRVTWANLRARPRWCRRRATSCVSARRCSFSSSGSSSLDRSSIRRAARDRRSAASNRHGCAVAGRSRGADCAEGRIALLPIRLDLVTRRGVALSRRRCCARCAADRARCLS